MLMLSLVRSPGRGLSCLRGLLLAFWHASLLAYWSSGMSHFWPVGLLACLASGLLRAFFGCSSGHLRAFFWLLACLASGLLVFWHVSLLACWPSGMPRFWPICLLACLASSLLAFFGSSSGLFRTLLLASGLFGMSCFWPSGLFDMLCFYFWPSYGFLVFLRSSGLPTAFGTPGLYDPWPLCLLACGFSRSSGLWLLSAFFSRPLAIYLIARCCSLGLLVLGLLVCALRSRPGNPILFLSALRKQLYFCLRAFEYFSYFSFLLDKSE